MSEEIKPFEGERPSELWDQFQEALLMNAAREGRLRLCVRGTNWMEEEMKRQAEEEPFDESDLWTCMRGAVQDRNVEEVLDIAARIQRVRNVPHA